MKLECDRAELDSSLRLVGQAINMSHPIAVLGCVFMEASKDRLTLVGDDQSMRIVMKIPADVAVEGAVAVPARSFLEIVSKLDVARIKLQSSSAGRLAISAIGFRTMLWTPDHASYPADAGGEYGPGTKLDGRALAAAMTLVGIAAAPASDARAVLTGLLFETSSEQLLIAACDSHRLAEYSLAVPASGLHHQRASLPMPSIGLLTRLLARSDVPDVIAAVASPPRSAFRFEAGPHTLTTSVLSGAYPDYRAAIPLSADCTAMLSAAPLSARLRALAAVARDDAHRVTVQLSDGAVQIAVAAKEIGTGSIRTPAKTSGIGARLSVNLQYLIDVLEVLHGEHIEVAISSNPARLLVRPADDVPYLYVVLPLQPESSVLGSSKQA